MGTTPPEPTRGPRERPKTGPECSGGVHWRDQSIVGRLGPLILPKGLNVLMVEYQID